MEKKDNFEHSMRSVVDQLDSKIAELEGFRQEVEKRVRAGHQLDANTTALNQICASLNSAKSARKLMMDSCCTIYNCNFYWEP